MKWKAEPIPRNGDERWTLRFAFLPVRCNDGFKRWLCDVYVRQRYVVSWGESWINVEYSATLP